MIRLIAIAAWFALARLSMSATMPSDAGAKTTRGVDLCGQHFDFSTKRVTCELTVVASLDLSGLETLPALEALMLRRVTLRDPNELGRLKHLRELELVDSPVESLVFVKSLSSLRLLNLTRSRVSDLGPLAEHPALEDVQLNQTSVTDLGVLATLPKVRRVGLSWLRIASWEPLALMQNLEFLNLSYTSISDLSVLGTLRGLRDLDLSSTAVTSVAALSPLTRLRRLTMNWVFIDDLRPLLRLPKLCRLSVELSEAQSTLLRRYPGICLGGGVLRLWTVIEAPRFSTPSSPCVLTHEAPARPEGRRRPWYRFGWARELTG